MAAILQCIIRHCFDAGDESGGGGRGSAPPMSRRMSRSVAMAHADSIGGYSPATIEDPHDDDAAGGCDIGGGAQLGSADTLGEEGHNHRGHRGIETGSATTSAGGGLSGLFSRLGFGGGESARYDTLVQTSGGEDGVGDAGSIQDGSSISSSGASPLRSASSFDYDKKMRSIPSIQLGEVLMPGSELQKQMSAIMAKDLESYDDEDECVVCLEVFTNENPRMPTLCMCGENKTYFHLPCLYQWIEQSKDCPSCRKRLRWEEF